MTPAIDAAMQSAIGYLHARQAADGHWEDYRLPVGRSDAWVTGYVGVALAESDHSETTRQSIDAAADWLATHRPSPAGWGYNGSTGPDADSTAFALTLLRLAGKQPRPADQAWLCQRWHPQGGFATYPRDDAWGQPHHDVTPAAFMALANDDREALRGAMNEVLQRTRNDDGTWPSYWWRTSHYATWWSLRLARELGWPPDGKAPVVLAKETHAVHTAFDLALVTGIASLQDWTPALTGQLAGKLLSLQQSDGAWPGGANLRVTEPDCYRPWSDRQARGRLYVDDDQLITTATALRVLLGVIEKIE